MVVCFLSVGVPVSRGLCGRVCLAMIGFENVFLVLCESLKSLFSGLCLGSKCVCVQYLAWRLLYATVSIHNGSSIWGGCG